MKKEIAFIFVIMILGIGLVSANNSGSMLITTKATPQYVSITVPDNITLPDIVPGYKSILSVDDKIHITNDGTTDVRITISDYTDNGAMMFENLKFGTTLSNLVSIENFSIEIDKPSEVYGTRDSSSFYVQLDFTELRNNFGEDYYTSLITFTATSI